MAIVAMTPTPRAAIDLSESASARRSTRCLRSRDRAGSRGAPMRGPIRAAAAKEPCRPRDPEGQPARARSTRARGRSDARLAAADRGRTQGASTSARRAAAGAGRWPGRRPPRLPRRGTPRAGSGRSSCRQRVFPSTRDRSPAHRPRHALVGAVTNSRRLGKEKGPGAIRRIAHRQRFPRRMARHREARTRRRRAGALLPE
jgi:hypothetical protein